MRQIRFVPKRPGGVRPWESAGFPDPGQWRTWSPHLCGICCLKMLTDTFGPHSQTLYSLLARCRELGGFEGDEAHGIRGVFHRPLLELARELGFEGTVEGRLSIDVLRRAVESGKLALLSIDLARVRGGLSGGHLLLVHAYDGESKEFLLHDCSEVLANPGENARVPEAVLEGISNRKGLIVWLAAAR